MDGMLRTVMGNIYHSQGGHRGHSHKGHRAKATGSHREETGRERDERGPWMCYWNWS